MPPRLSILAVLLLLPASVVGSAHKNCTHADVWSKATASFDLSDCVFLNATAVKVDATALALALSVTVARHPRGVLADAF